MSFAFIGVDLGWYGKPTGLASIRLDDAGLHLQSVARIQPVDEILHWIQSEAGEGGAVAAVDAPLVIANQTGVRPAERDLNRDFRRFHAGCHAANLGRPFANHVISFSRQLEALGFRHGACAAPREEGRFQIEVHPHAASIGLFGLDRIVKYKRGPRAQRARELERFRRLLLTRLPSIEPHFRFRLPRVPQSGDLKPVEDRIDAVFCAFIAYYWGRWGTEGSVVYGAEETGYIVVPKSRC